MRSRSRTALAVVLVVGGIVAPVAPAGAQVRDLTPPTVESEYFVEDGGPPGATGPGEFTFTANGAADVVGFEWDGIGVPPGSVAADSAGGSATVTITPPHDGPVSISVTSVDATGNRSDAETYRFWAAATSPTTSLRHEHYFGEQVTVTLTARQQDAATFTYTWEVEDGQPEHSLPVGADGTAALDVVLPDSGQLAYLFTVWTTDTDGQRSQVTEQTVGIDDRGPFIFPSATTVAVGETLTVDVEAVFLGDVLTYRWWVDDGPVNTVAAAADDSASFTYTPTTPGVRRLSVQATYASGVSGTTWRPLRVT